MKPNKFKYTVITAMLLIFGLLATAQEKPEKLKKESDRYISEAQEALSENDFASAEASYRKAISKDPSNTSAKYNIGNLYYGKEKATTAESRLKEAAEVAATKEEKHSIYHNLGNSYMKQKNYQAAVTAFKNALRNDPTDDETRYNLALAKKMLEKEKQDQDKNKDKNKDQDKKDQDKKDQQQNKDQNKDGEGGDDQNKDQKPKDEGENEKDKKEGDQNKDQQKDKGDQKKDEGKGDEEKKQQPKPAQGQLSQQQIKSLLEAMNNEEKKVQDKMNAKKAKGVKVKSEKDW